MTFNQTDLNFFFDVTFLRHFRAQNSHTVAIYTSFIDGMSILYLPSNVYGLVNYAGLVHSVNMAGSTPSSKQRQDSGTTANIQDNLNSS